jgi:hypothetical protein
MKPGTDLLSREVYLQVPSALAVFTAVFGMGTGVSPPLKAPGYSFQVLGVAARTP